MRRLSRPTRRVSARYAMGWLVGAAWLSLACAHGPAGTSHRVEFEDAEGETLFRIERRGSSVRAVLGDGRALARARIEADGVTVSDRAGEPVGRVEPPSERHVGYRLTALDGSGERFDLQFEPDGDLELENADGDEVYEAKRRDYGFKVVDGRDRLRLKVRAREGKISFRSPSGRTYMSTRDPIPLAAAVALGLEDVRFEYALALSLAVMQWPVAAP